MKSSPSSTPRSAIPTSGATIRPSRSSRGDLLGNVERAAGFECNRQPSARSASRSIRTEWGMTPQTVNAYYNPTLNEIVFPAAMLQPPFFDPQADDAVNYGGIGAVIGHEMTHGFDDQGRQFDGEGNLSDWWTDERQEGVRGRSRQSWSHSSTAYKPLPGVHIKGELTLGENIADLAGIADRATTPSISLRGQPAPVIDSLTGDQRFFRATRRCGATRPATKRDRRAAQERSALRRASSALMGAAINVDAFHEAFDTKPGDKMWKAPGGPHPTLVSDDAGMSVDCPALPALPASARIRAHELVKRSGRRLLGICGPPGAGKSTLAVRRRPRSGRTPRADGRLPPRQRRTRPARPQDRKGAPDTFDAHGYLPCCAACWRRPSRSCTRRCSDVRSMKR